MKLIPWDWKKALGGLHLLRLWSYLGSGENRVRGVRQVWRSNKRMGSSRSQWLLGRTYMPAAAGQQITHQAVQLCLTSGVLGRQEEGTVAASLLHSWQKCWYMGEGPETRGTCVSCYPPLWHSRSVITQKGTKDCYLSLEKFPLTRKWEPCMNKNLWIYPGI